MTSVKHSAGFSIHQPVERVFPLFNAEGETLWVPNWCYENIMGHTRPHEDYIFLTQDHDHGSTPAIWLVKRYEPENHFIAFYKVEPESKVGIISVKCRARSEQATDVRVSYEYVALGPEGDAFIASFTFEKYQAYMEEWKTLLDAYFAADRFGQ